MISSKTFKNFVIKHPLPAVHREYRAFQRVLKKILFILYERVLSFGKQLKKVGENEKISSTEFFMTRIKKLKSD
jgi:hypothetical protein